MKKIRLYLFGVCCLLGLQVSAQEPIAAAGQIRKLSDSALLDQVQRQTFRYFWDFGHPVSGMARERSNTSFHYGNEVVTTGGSGFGIMAMVVAANRHWISRKAAAARIQKIVRFLDHADSFHGAYPHWMNGATGKVIPFSPKDDGADLVETSYLFQGLLTARQYFDGDGAGETELRKTINHLWNRVEWNWFTKGGENVLYWHWSPKNGWAMNFPIHGYNECLITYVLAASSDRFSIDSTVYHKGWATGANFKNGKTFYGYLLPLGFDYGGPLFFSHYSFLGLDPRGLKDRYADYWVQNTHHTLINYFYCQNNPKHFAGYSPYCWGLTASDNFNGYDAHSPTNDLGVISPTAAISSLPYTPEYSMRALRFYYDELGSKLWGEYGIKDAFSLAHFWFAASYLAIDQGPEIVMIENYRTGLIWKLFMSCPEVQNGLTKLDFESPYLN